MKTLPERIAFYTRKVARGNFSLQRHNRLMKYKARMDQLIKEYKKYSD